MMDDPVKIKCDIDHILNYNLYRHLGMYSACDVVENYCSEQDGYMFLKLYYCTINQSTIMLLIFSLVFVFIAFHLLSSTAENYLSPALTNLSNKLGLSETLAGVTLVAIGNGAPDVIVAISAAQGGGHEDDDDDGISFTIGSIFGAGIFVTTMCFSLVLIKAGGEIKPNRAMFLRDLSFYWIAVATIIAYGFVGKIYWWMALLFIMIYIIYIIVVIILENIQKKKEAQQAALENKSQVNQTQNEMLHAHLYENNTPDVTVVDQSDRSQNQKLGSLNQTNSEDEGEQQVQSSKQNQDLNRRIKEDHYERQNVEVPQKVSADITGQQAKKQSFFKLKHSVRLKLLNARVEWTDLEFADKIIYLWEIPADFIRNITIAPADETWSKWRAMVAPIFGPIFFLVSGFLPEDVYDPFDDSNWYIYVILGSLGLLASIVVWKTTHKSTPPSFCWVFSTMAFIISIAWINAVADFLIEFLSFLQIVTEINKVFLGMTFLAYGNSAGDYFTNGQLAAMGYGNMALTACYAGQLFNLLIGFGLTMIISAGKNGMDFDLFGLHSNQDTSGKLGTAIGYVIVFCALINCTIIIIYSFINKFTYGKQLGNFLRLFYLGVFLGCMSIGIASDITAPVFEG